VAFDGPDAGTNTIEHVVVLVVDALRADMFHEPDPDLLPFFAEQAGEAIRFQRAYPPGNSTQASLPAMIDGSAPTPPFQSATPSIYDALDVDGSLLAFGDFVWMRSPERLGIDTDTYRFFKNKVPPGRFSPVAVDVTKQRLDAIDEGASLLLMNYIADPHGAYVCDDGTEGGKACFVDEVRAIDRAVREIFAALEARDMLDDTLVILTSDHGEEFGERGYWHHATDLHEVQIHVPLWMWWPGLEGRTVDVPVSSGGLAATIADALDQPPADGWNYPSLLPLASGKTDEYPVPIVHHWTEVDKRIPVRRSAFVTPEWKLIVDWRSGQSFLYDVRPGSADWDLRDLSAERPGVARDLRRRFLTVE
jgi:hypothetical protein